jgi:hypothetical protein
MANRKTDFKHLANDEPKKELADECDKSKILRHCLFNTLLPECVKSMLCRNGCTSEYWQTARSSSPGRNFKLAATE